MLSRLVTSATVAASLATVLAYGGRWFWASELLVNFRTHFVLVLGLALVLALVLRRWWIVGAAALSLALNLWPMHGVFMGPEARPAASDARPVRVAAFNVNIANEDIPGIAAYLETVAPDVVVLEESPANADRLAALLPQLPHRYFAEEDGVWGVVILSRWPLIAPRPAMAGDVPFGARADVNLGDRTFRLYGVHLHWPVVPDSERIRNHQLRAIGRELAGCEQACVVVGDFNVTPWSSHFRDVLKTSGVRDCAAGRGLLNTWSASLPTPLRIRIDQCLIAGAAGVAGVRVGENVGSDHFATINDLLIGSP